MVTITATSCTGTRFHGGTGPSTADTVTARANRSTTASRRRKVT